MDVKDRMATYAKLPNGLWGIRIDGDAQRGERFSVIANTGKIRRETVIRVIWTCIDKYRGGMISLCSIKSIGE